MHPLPPAIEPLTAEAFLPFGEVIETRAGSAFWINEGSTERFDALAKVQLSSPEDTASISLFRAQPVSFPLHLRVLERHPLGSQAFFPVDGRPYLVVVAPPLPAATPTADSPLAAQDAIPDLSRMRVFLAHGHQGVNYYRNTWHHPLLCLGAVSHFLVVDRQGAGHNCVEYPLPSMGAIPEQPVLA